MDGVDLQVLGQTSRPFASRRRIRASFTIVLVSHVGLLLWLAWREAPTANEPSHLAAGISHWQFGRFELYRVNPPLVRLVAALPVLLAGVQTDWHSSYEAPGARCVFPVGADLAESNGERFLWLMALARWSCVPFSVLGAYICWCYSHSLYGARAGLIALSLWCFSPNILAHASLITPDAAAASMGVACCYLFWRWLKQPGWCKAIASGLVLGLAELTKSTWVILFGIWPLVWLTSRCTGQCRRNSIGWLREFWQLNCILFLAVYVVNLGYGFEGTFQRLGDYSFVSETLAGPGSVHRLKTERGNRFEGTSLSALPVPLPRNYLQGIDIQKRDFEANDWAYLRGEWRRGGWWYYYLYALAVKVPLGTWTLILLALYVGCRHAFCASRWWDELVLLLPAICVLLLVSSQTGLNEHLRYVLPMFPFVFIWTSKVGRSLDAKHACLAVPIVLALVWSVSSSLSVYPHSLSYFNELVGGPRYGHIHLLGSNVDWGQDLLCLKRWVDEHPEAHPLYVSYHGGVKAELVGIKSDACQGLVVDEGPRPGWYAVSATNLHDRDGGYSYLQKLAPTAVVGFSIFIYHITRDEANRVRRELGLPEIESIASERHGSLSTISD